MVLLFLISLAHAACEPIYCKADQNGNGLCSTIQDKDSFPTQLDAECKVQWGSYDVVNKEYKFNNVKLDEKATAEDIPTVDEKLSELETKIQALEAAGGK